MRLRRRYWLSSLYSLNRDHASSSYVDLSAPRYVFGITNRPADSKCAKEEKGRQVHGNLSASRGGVLTNGRARPSSRGRNSDETGTRRARNVHSLVVCIGTKDRAFTRSVVSSNRVYCAWWSSWLIVSECQRMTLRARWGERPRRVWLAWDAKYDTSL